VIGQAITELEDLKRAVYKLVCAELEGRFWYCGVFPQSNIINNTYFRLASVYTVIVILVKLDSLRKKLVRILWSN